MTARLLTADNVVLDLAKMEFSEPDMRRIENALRASYGMIVVTGPAGSGKTTVLYSCLNRMATPERKLVSIENPVEYMLPGVTQIAARPDRGLTFAVAIRAAMRSSADVIMIGEIRELEALQQAQEAALSGVPVLAAMNCEDAASTLVRMMELGSDAFVAGESTKLIVAQRLLRRLCKHCAAPAMPPAAQLERAAIAAKAGGLNWDTLPRTFKAPVGCPQCGNTGYRGRKAIAEALDVTPQMTAAIRRNSSVDEVRKLAVANGMTTFVADGLRRAAQGITSLEEALRYAP